MPNILYKTYLLSDELLVGTEWNSQIKSEKLSSKGVEVLTQCEVHNYVNKINLDSKSRAQQDMEDEMCGIQ